MSDPHIQTSRRNRRVVVENASDYLPQGESPFNIDEIGEMEPTIDVVERVVNNDKFAEEAFMNEIVTVMVHESTDPNDADIVPIWVNGRVQHFMRGNPQDVRRCYVERLARAKSTNYSQNLDNRLGEAMNMIKPRTALRYPFSVVEDKNPKGAAWLKAILAERA